MDEEKEVCWVKDPFTMTVTSEKSIDFTRTKLAVYRAKSSTIPDELGIKDNAKILIDSIDTENRAKTIVKDIQLDGALYNFEYEIVKSVPNRSFSIEIRIYFTSFVPKLDGLHDMGKIFRFYLLNENEDAIPLESIYAFGNNLNNQIQLKDLPNEVVQKRTYNISNFGELGDYYYICPYIYDNLGVRVDNVLQKVHNYDFYFDKLEKNKKYYFVYTYDQDRYDEGINYSEFKEFTLKNIPEAITLSGISATKNFETTLITSKE